MTAKRIALVPYEPGHEPEGMVSSLDPEAYHPDGCFNYGDGRGEEVTGPHLAAIAAAVKAARRDPWEEWRESREPYMTAWPDVLGLVEALRWISEWGVGGAAGRAREALRKAGAPVDEPAVAEDVPELWVSRDSLSWSDVWGHEPVWDGYAYGADDSEKNSYLPRGIANALGLKPGEHRRVTREEFERFFRPVMDLPRHERMSAIRNLIP